VGRGVSHSSCELEHARERLLKCCHVQKYIAVLQKYKTNEQLVSVQND